MIDLRSDTVTRPTDAMREAMASAPVGDDVFGDDPSVNALEARIAKLSGKQAAMLVPSGTQSNLVALLTHCQRGEEYIVGQDYHTYLYEAGGAAVLGSIQPQPLGVEADGSLDLRKVEAVIKPKDDHFALSRLLVLENTHNGKVLNLDYMHRAHAFARERGLDLHLDGARIFNAAIELGVPLEALTRHADSVSICASKGLGAPVGSLLCGSADFIKRARHWRKMVGGGMRQAGFLAAAIDYALDHHIERLREDHQNAQLLAQGLAEIAGVEVESVQTNMVYIKFASKPLGQQMAEELLPSGVYILGGLRARLVTHLGISAADVKRCIEIFTRHMTDIG